MMENEFSSLTKEEKIEVMFTEYHGTCIGMAVQILGDMQRAQDAVQTAYINAYNALDNFTGNRWRRWLGQIVKRCCWDILDLYYTRKTVVGVHEGARHPEKNKLSCREDVRFTVQEAIRSLSEYQQKIIYLCYFRGIPYSEVAEIVGTKRQNIKSTCYKARKRLGSMPEIQALVN